MDDYLVSDTITAFIVQMQHATTDVLKEKLYQLMCGGPGQGVVVALVRYPRRQAAYSKIPPLWTPLRGGHGHES